MCWVCSISNDLASSMHREDGDQTFWPFTTPATGPNNKPIYNLDQIIVQLSGGPGITADAFAGANITYSVPTTAPNPLSNVAFLTEINGFVAPSAARTAAANLAFEMWDDIIAPNLNPVSGSSAQMNVRYYGSPDKNATYANFVTSGQAVVNGTTVDSIVGGNAWFSTRWIEALDANLQTASGGIAFGNRGFTTLMHEIGHLLGFTHPGKYDASDPDQPTYVGKAVFAQDTVRYTIMSYFRANEDGSGTNWGQRQYFLPNGQLETVQPGNLNGDGNSVSQAVGTALFRGVTPSSPMLMDIVVAQARYGADLTTRTGNDIYGFGSAIPNRPMYNFDINTSPVLTIYDANGVDTLNTNKYTVSQTINLNPGTYSNIGGLTNNIAISFNTWIENALGGSGRDTIIGNARDNLLYGNEDNDIIDGGAGNDTIFGGSGDDTLTAGAGANNVLEGGTGNDTLIAGYSVGDFAIMRGGADNDTYIFDGVGFAIEENANEGEDIVEASTSYTLPDGSTVFVENLLLKGGSNIDGTGNRLDNVLIGNEGSNRLSGLGGRDTLVGGALNDILDGGEGYDILDGGIGDDQFILTSTARPSGITFSPGDLAYDEVIEREGSGQDTVFVQAASANINTGVSFTSYTLPVNVEDMIIIGNVDFAGIGNVLGNGLRGNNFRNTLTGLQGDDVLNGLDGYDVLIGGKDNDYYVLESTANSPFASNFSYFYDAVTELLGEGIDTIDITPSLSGINRLTFAETFFSNFAIPDNVENIIVRGSRDFGITGNGENNFIIGNSGVNSLSGGLGSDTLEGGLGNDTLNGGEGIDKANFKGVRANYSVTKNSDGSYTVRDAVAGRDGTDTLVGIEQLQFSDQTFSLINDLSFASLFAATLSQGKAIAAAYQTLLGGIPSAGGFDFLIKANLATNFGAGEGAVFNDENIFINVTNALVQGNATAAARFGALSSGTTLAEKIASLYASVIPAAKRTADGVNFLTRPDGLKFYQDVANERGITSENGPAVIALASLLKVAVDGKIGIGNPVGDLVAAIADGSAGLPTSSASVQPIETVDGTRFDADDAPDALPGFAGPPPATPVGVVGLAYGGEGFDLVA